MALNQHFLEYRIHFFDLKARFDSRWENDGEALNQARAAGVEVDLHPNHIRFEYTSVEQDFAKKFETANTAFPKATSVRLLRPSGSGNRDYPEFLKTLKNYKHLEELIIEYAVLSDESMKLIGELTNLKTLHLNTASEVSGTGLAHLKTLTKLETLRLMNCYKLKENVLSSLSQLTSLKHLDLSLTSSIKIDGAEKLADLKNLKSLKITGNQSLNGTLFKYLKSLKHLETLELLKFPLTDRDIDDLVELKGLTYLLLEYQQIPFSPREFSNKGVEKMKALTELHTFMLTDGTELHLRSLSDFNWKKLKTLSVTGFEMRGDDLKFIENATELRHLSLPRFPNNDRYSFDTLKKFEKLKTLSIGYIGASYEEIKNMNLPVMLVP